MHCLEDEKRDSVERSSRQLACPAEQRGRSSSAGQGGVGVVPSHVTLHKTHVTLHKTPIFKQSKYFPQPCLTFCVVLPQTPEGTATSELHGQFRSSLGATLMLGTT